MERKILSDIVISHFTDDTIRFPFSFAPIDEVRAQLPDVEFVSVPSHNEIRYGDDVTGIVN